MPSKIAQIRCAMLGAHPVVRILTDAGIGGTA